MVIHPNELVITMAPRSARTVRGRALVLRAWLRGECPALVVRHQGRSVLPAEVDFDKLPKTSGSRSKNTKMARVSLDKATVVMADALGARLGIEDRTQIVREAVRRAYQTADTPQKRWETIWSSIEEYQGSDGTRARILEQRELLARYGNLLRRARVDAGLSGLDVSDFSKISLGVLMDIESLQSPPLSDQETRAVCVVLNKDPADLLAAAAKVREVMERGFPAAVPHATESSDAK